MGRHHAVVPQSAGNDRGSHPRPARRRSPAEFIHPDIRLLNNARHRGCVRLFFGAARKPATTVSTAVCEATSPRSSPPTPSAKTKSHPRVRPSFSEAGIELPRKSSLWSRTRPTSVSSKNSSSSMKCRQAQSLSTLCCSDPGADRFRLQSERRLSRAHMPAVNYRWRCCSGQVTINQ